MRKLITQIITSLLFSSSILLYSANSHGLYIIDSKGSWSVIQLELGANQDDKRNVFVLRAHPKTSGFALAYLTSWLDVRMCENHSLRVGPKEKLKSGEQAEVAYRIDEKPVINAGTQFQSLGYFWLDLNEAPYPESELQSWLATGNTLRVKISYKLGDVIYEYSLKGYTAMRDLAIKHCVPQAKKLGYNPAADDYFN